jgi:hypothetical protein
LKAAKKKKKKKNIRKEEATKIFRLKLYMCIFCPINIKTPVHASNRAWCSIRETGKRKRDRKNPLKFLS